MRFHTLNATLKTAILAVTVLLLGTGFAVGQVTVTLTAGPSTATLPDGSAVPMWGYACDAASIAAGTCRALNPAATAGVWSPVVITVPTGQNLIINLTNNLSFTPTGSTTANNIPTSLMIVGQLGGGLGTTATSNAASNWDHFNAQPLTWPIAGDAPGAGLTGVGVPPTQGPRVQSFAGEVSAVAATTTATCTVPTATPATGCGTLTWTAPRPGTYLLESGTHPSIQGPMGLYGMVVVTEAPSATAVAPATPTTGCAYTPVAGATCVVPYNAEADLLFSEIDPVQNNAVQTAVTTAGFSETMVWSGQPGGCGNPSSATYQQCYPPAVNYTPLYYLINGVAFNKTNAGASLFATTPATGLTAVTGQVLVRMVNAGSRMHVPSVVGSLTTQVVASTGVTPAPVPGLGLVAEDGNALPGATRVQSEVFMAAGKTYDVMVNVPATPTSATAPPALPVYDRELSLSDNGTGRDGGMLAYIGANGAGVPVVPALASAAARADTYSSLIAGQTLTVSDPSRGVVANDTNVYGVHLLTQATNGVVTLYPNGSFTYVPNSGSTATGDSFTYCANNAFTPATTTTPASCSSAALTATVTLGAGDSSSGIACSSSSYTANTANYIAIKTPGVLAFCKDSKGFPLTATSFSGGGVLGDANGGFSASLASPCTTSGGCLTSFTFQAKNSQGVLSPVTTVHLTFPAGTGPQVTVLDGADKKTVISDYRWIIEEDRTFYVDPNCTTNSATPIPGCTPPAGTTVPPTFGVNFHTSYMPVVASGCTGPLSCEGGQTIICGVAGAPACPTGTAAGSHIAAICDIGNGVCRYDSAGIGTTQTSTTAAVLDPAKRYYISILPGDAANPFIGANGSAPANCAIGPYDATDPTGFNTACGHGMGGAPIPVACTLVAPATTCTGSFAPVTILTQPAPFPPAKLTVFVFEDDFPLNGEHDAGGGTGAVNTTNEPGLGGFEITLFDDAGGTGDATGQLTHDMFNQPLSNSLAGTVDPTSGLDACPITPNPLVGMDSSNGNATGSLGTLGITGRIVTCPEFEADGLTPSPIAGQAVVANMMQGRYGVVATPAADRIARGEEWLQTNTLDGQKAHDSFLRIGEPSYFQEYGPAGWHVTIGFANPQIINSRLAGVCGNTDPNITGLNCNNTLTGSVSTSRMSRTPDERLYGSGSIDSFAFTQCYVSVGDPDGEDFAFTKCAADGSFSLSGLPDGNWRVTVFDQWNDMLVDGLSTPVGLSKGATGGTTDLGQIATGQWQANIYTSSFFDQNGDGVRQDSEPGQTLVATNIRFRDGSYSNFNNTDLNGNAGFNEVFPLFSWYVIESDTTRYKTTGTHVVYDAGGPADGTLSTCGGALSGTGYPRCGNSTIGHLMANTAEQVSLPSNLRVPGAVYCTDADCSGASVASGPVVGGSSGPTTGNLSTGRIDPPVVHPYGSTYGWQGFSGQNSFLEFGKQPYVPGENGGIHGEVNYASTRPFDDPQLLLHVSWTPDVPNVTVNLYKEGFAADGVTPTLTLVDTTKTSSWDDWAQGFNATSGLPNMNCPGQSTADLFYFSLQNQLDYLDVYNFQHGNEPALHTIPNNSQFKCYDGMHNWNQLQPAPYDGMYSFPSITGINPTTGKPSGTNCTACVPNPDTTDPYRAGLPMLPAGKYVVEVVVPPGYELVKEEDKNILIGDNYIAPVTQEFGALGSIYILPDQAAIGASYNANNAQNSTSDLGTLSLVRGEGDTGSVEEFWPCVGEARVVPDFMSIFPNAQEVAAFAGATRNLCDRKEVTVADQSSSLAKFYIFSSAHVAAHFTGVITDDYTSEFDPFSPQFGEKFSPPDLPVSVKDWAGNEISRVYADHWGTYDGLTYSSWEVNPPNPTGYGPTMMVTCMNDPGTGPTPDPLFNPQYSQFCYEIPFMPGQTQYMDTPVVPTSAFAGAGYNNVDCAYPDATPAVKEVDGDQVGPYVSAAGHALTITALGDQMVPNNAYVGPQASTAPYNQKFVKRHYGFGSATGTVTIGGVAATVTSWSDSQIKVNTPSSGVPPCLVNQQAQYGGSAALCGQLLITTAATTTGTGQVTGITVLNPGAGYTARATATFTNTGSGGTGAAATNSATTGVFMGVSGVVIPAAGTGRGYALPPTVTFSAPQLAGGVTASGTGVLGTGANAGRVVAVTINTAGSGYTAQPTVTFSPPTNSAGVACAINTTTCVRATAASSAVRLLVTSVILSSGGTGYTGNPTLTINAPPTGGVRATVAAQASPIQNFAAKQSIDTVTVTIGGKGPKHVAASDSIQSALDAASPGDLIIVDPTCSSTIGAPGATTTTQVACTTGITTSQVACRPTATTACTSAGAAAHNEMLLMWKPVRLQGVGAASSIINANTHPAGTTKLDAWRQEVDCLFGIGLNGSPINNNPAGNANDVNRIQNKYDPTGQVACPGANWTYFNGFDESSTGAAGKNPQVDRLPLEAVVGWSGELNGNLAELLQEPSLMGALEGAGITVLSKGVNFPTDPYDSTLLMGFPTGTTLLTGDAALDISAGGNFPTGDANPLCKSGTGGSNPFPSNYMCNPSRIDGLGITDSSQGGGGIFVHGWGHNLQIANNRIYSNAGTLSGGINLGQGEFAGIYTQGSATNAPPGSCEDSPVVGANLPYCENINVNIHNNYVALNSSTGDELFSATPAGAGGVSICTGADYYKFNYNWVCGNLSSGDGGGVGHLGYIFNGDIEHNTIIFNQSTNPTIPTNGGGLVIMGTPDQDLVCTTLPNAPDQDCAPTQAVGGAASVGASDGVGPGLVVNANLIMGNAAESGTGAGIAFNAVNGSDMVAFPTDPGSWNTVTVTNNIIADNVGGWDGAGISLADSPMVNIINNTIAYNSSTATAGILFNTLGAPLASQGGSSCANGATPAGTGGTTCPQPAGLVAIQHSPVLLANLSPSVNIICPPGHFQTTATNGSCRSVSYPKLENNVFWHNSSFYVGVGAFSPQYQQNVISLFNAFTHTAVASQPAADATTTTSGSATITGGTGACVTTTQSWDIGVRGDLAPTGTGNHQSGVTLTASDSVLTPSGSSVLGGGNATTDPRFIQQYCDGSRIPPEAVSAGLLAQAAAGWQVPPGISDATVPNPLFNLGVSATVDEGNNWVNTAWGPLSMTNPTVTAGLNGNYGGGLPLGNYAIASASSARARVAGGTNAVDAPNFDFFNNPRKPGPIDAGAVQFTGAGTNRDFTMSPGLVDFGFVPIHSPTTVDQDVQVINTGLVPLTFNSTSIGLSCTNVATCNLASFTIASDTCYPAGTNGTTTLAPGASCVINVVFNPTSTSQAARNAALSVNPIGNGSAEFVYLTGHDSIATLAITPLTPALTFGGASNTAVRLGTITITNTANPNTNVDAGPWIPTAITLTQLSGFGAFTLGGTCAVGTAVNPGGTLVPPAAGSSCTITITYTPPPTGNPAGSAQLTVSGLGTTNITPISTTYGAN